MLRHLRTLIFLASLVVSAPSADRDGDGRSSKKTSSEVERSLERFLGSYYDEHFPAEEATSPSHGEDPEDIYDTMQGDQPPEDDAKATVTGKNVPDIEYIRAMRNSNRQNLLDGRTRDNWIQILKENILRQIGRDNTTVLTKQDERLSSLNVSDIIPGIFNTTIIPDDNVGERIRSFYPSCDIPLNTDQDAWKDDDVMNLYFNLDHSDSKNTNIATATLRLYRLPVNNTKATAKSADCDGQTSTEDDRLLRISIYWYTKSLKKRRMKRRLSDSKVITDGTRWVDLSVKPATKAWFKGKNLGLGVLVEDQEGNTLRAEKFFKGASCMVGTSTPKPIPTIIVDAARQNHELNRYYDIFGRNTTSALYSDLQLLPTIDICTLEFPENYTQPPHIMGLRVNACNLKKLHEQSQQQAEKERRERLDALVSLTVPNLRHIRHQRQHLASKKVEERGYDPRSGVVGSTVIVRNTDLTNNFNFSITNR